MHPRRLPTPVFSNEIRLGLVLYGGVSLAIYMNGVCREFYDAVRGRGVYKLIKALTDSDIVIDILSGTSAGGVNGILLGYAIANSDEHTVVDFRQFADLWINSGSAEKLFGKPWEVDSKSRRENSLFSGEYYQEELEKAFTESSTRALEGEWFSSFKELDLFITATDLDGSVHQVPDNAGSVIDIKSHRSVFHLAHRRDQGDYLDNPFLPGKTTRRTLAKLARITSCFPVAFPVVGVEFDPLESNEVDSRLVRWGRLWDRVVGQGEGPRTLSFVDGGVLSNRPFSTTIDAIYARTAYRPTYRKLYYLDPNPEEFGADSRAQEWAESPLRVAMSSKIEIPNYQSISGDLERIRLGNQQVVRHQVLRKAVTKMSAEQIRNLDTSQHSDPIGLSTYRQCRVLGVVDSAIRHLLENTESQQAIHDEILEAALTMLDQATLSDSLRDDRVDRIAAELAPWDVAFFIRKHCFLLGILSREIHRLQRPPSGRHPAPGDRADPRVKKFLGLRYLTYHLSWQLELLHILNRAQASLLSHYDLEEILQKGEDGEHCFSAFQRFLCAFYSVIFGRSEGGGEPSADDGIADWEPLLERYYELVKVVAFPDIDFHHHPIGWGDLRMVLPERGSDTSQQIFAKIHQLPVCAMLRAQTIHEQRMVISSLKLRVSRRASTEPQGSILPVVDRHSLELIEEARGHLDDEDLFLRLKALHEHFEAIDRLMFPYEYLSNVSTRNRIDLVRVSPNDTLRHGYGRGLDLERKLKGYQLNAFGGFFRKEWRTNDLLWGRLDSLDRLVSGLLNEETLAGFQHYFRRNCEAASAEGAGGDTGIPGFIEDLMEECLPAASEDERQRIQDYLLSLHRDVPQGTEHDQQARQGFLDAVIRAGQRQILLEEGEESTLQQDLRQTELSLGRQGKDVVKNLEEHIDRLREAARGHGRRA
ncbi:MAG: patatin-like protein, partial [Synechococcaceae cyanobacterium]|nr:patatin-like protein [Synechococcaceae cyanobacterium]